MGVFLIMPLSDNHLDENGVTRSPFFSELRAYVMTFHDEEGATCAS
ncbi:MAG TPA: hypothetical protein VF534_04610 [Paraburkholderia sp.]